LPDGSVRKITGLYFEVITNAKTPEMIGSLADELYRGVLSDTKLSNTTRTYSLYPLYFYVTREEYLQKTGMPQWSDGVFRQGVIASWENPNYLRAKEVLAHEITHLIFWEFFGESRMDLLWLNEGLAMYEDSKVQGPMPPGLFAFHQQELKTGYIAFSKLMQTHSAFDHKPDEVETFYIESWFLVKYLLEQGGGVGFYEMLRAFKEHKSLEEAVALAYPSKWRNLSELEGAFKKECQIP